MGVQTHPHFLHNSLRVLRVTQIVKNAVITIRKATDLMLGSTTSALQTRLYSGRNPHRGTMALDLKIFVLVPASLEIEDILK